MDEGRKRVLAIVAGILVARHIKDTEELHEFRQTPRTVALIASAIRWARQIMDRIDRDTAGGYEPACQADIKIDTDVHSSVLCSHAASEAVSWQRKKNLKLRIIPP